MSKYERLWKFLKEEGTQSAELTFGQIEEIAGVPVDHSFLRDKKELKEYGYEVVKIFMKKQTVLFRKIEKSTIVVYLHGKGGNVAEAEHYKKLFPDCAVTGLDYKAQTPWKAEDEFPQLLETACIGYDSVILVANSIGAYFALSALSRCQIEKAFLISPVVDMEKVIRDMMRRTNVSERELYEKKEIAAAKGETLSWDYFAYAKAQRIRWKIPTAVLYGERDCLTSLETVTDFAKAVGASLTVMPNGEHWFHTEEQMKFLDEWIIANDERCESLRKER